MDEDAVEARIIVKKIDDLWKRGDRAEWTPELGRAHAALAKGREWGLAWAALVSQFFDFEKLHGFKAEGGQIGVKDRPKQVKDWIAGSRKWDAVVGIGLAGRQGRKGTFADEWWKWWAALQPAEREMIGGSLTCPEDADWAKMSELHGKNGLMQVMVSLLWWGDYVWDEYEPDPIARLEWEAAISDVYWVLTELQRPAVLK